MQVTEPKSRNANGSKYANGMKVLMKLYHKLIAKCGNSNKQTKRPKIGKLRLKMQM